MMGSRRQPPAACKEFEPDLVLYYYGDSPAEMKSRVETHLQECASCGRFLEELRTVLPLTVKPSEPPPDFWDAYSTELRRKLAAVEPRGFWMSGLTSLFSSWRAPAAAMAAVVLLVIGLSLGKGIWRPAQAPLSESDLQTILGTKESMEFFQSLEFLESMDLLESVEAGRAGKKAG